MECSGCSVPPKAMESSMEGVSCARAKVFLHDWFSRQQEVRCCFHSVLGHEPGMINKLSVG